MHVSSELFIVLFISLSYRGRCEFKKPRDELVQVQGPPKRCPSYYKFDSCVLRTVSNMAKQGIYLVLLIYHTAPINK